MTFFESVLADDRSFQNESEHALDVVVRTVISNLLSVREMRRGLRDSDDANNAIDEITMSSPRLAIYDRSHEVKRFMRSNRHFAGKERVWW